jgi:hypothetical protein
MGVGSCTPSRVSTSAKAVMSANVIGLILPLSNPASGGPVSAESVAETHPVRSMGQSRAADFKRILPILARLTDSRYQQRG